MGENCVGYVLIVDFVFMKGRIFCNIQNLFFIVDFFFCIVFGYSLYLVLGCIKLFILIIVFILEQWVVKCVEDGGKFILINLVMENQVLVDFFSKQVVNYYNIWVMFFIGRYYYV